MAPDAKVAKAMFDIWRVDQVSPDWENLREDERLAWLRLAEFTLDVAAATMSAYLTGNAG